MSIVQIFVLAPFLLFLSVGCQHFSKATESNAQGMKPGLTMAEVKAKVGEPESVQATTGMQTIWHYWIQTNDHRHGYPYIANFNNGILKSWDFDTEASKPNSKLNEDRAKSRSDQPSLPFAQPSSAPPIN